jgi:hypothetical protein
MKVLTATTETQGWRSDDFCWTVEGEMVIFPPIECDCHVFDDHCGCRRAMAGLVSQRATTTIKVADREELDTESYYALIVDGLRDQGYVTGELLNDPEVTKWVQGLMDDLMRVADAYPVETILERRGDVISARRGCDNLSAVDRR